MLSEIEAAGAEVLPLASPLAIPPAQPCPASRLEEPRSLGCTAFDDDVVEAMAGPVVLPFVLVVAIGAACASAARREGGALGAMVPRFDSGALGGAVVLLRPMDLSGGVAGACPARETPVVKRLWPVADCNAAGRLEC